MRQGLDLSIKMVSIMVACVFAVSISEASRQLEWSDLVPESWEPPIIAPAFDSELSEQVDPGSLVPELDNLVVSIPGYMKPIVFEGQLVSEFLLVPYLPHQVSHHSHLDANQRVYVSLVEGLLVENPFQPVWVMGTLSTDTMLTDEGPAGYKISGAEVAPYVTDSVNK